MSSHTDKILDLAAQHPEWGGTKIARYVGCHPGHARRVVSEFRRGLAKPASKAGKYTVGVLADIHCPYHDEDALGIALDFIASKDPDEIVILGDLADFYKASFFSTDPERMPLAEEVDACKRMIAHIAKKFPRARKSYLEGNHEQRLMRFLCEGKARELKGIKSLEVPVLLGIEDAGFQYVVNADRKERGEEPFSIGKLFLTHGHEIKCSWGAVNIPRIYYQKTHVNIMVAHHHRTQEHTVRRWDGPHEGGWSVGCLCNMSPLYSAQNDWNHGFSMVYFDDDGDFAVKGRKIINGKVL